MPEKKEFFTLRQDMLEKKYFFVITERRHAKSNNKQTPLSPNNDKAERGRLNPRKGVKNMKTISFKQTESALFNLDSMRTKLLNEQYEQPEREDELRVRIDEVENLLEKLYFGSVTRSEWNRIQEIINERQTQRYVTCLNSGMDERDAAGAFDD